jgi:hypothetical protein
VPDAGTVFLIAHGRFLLCEMMLIAARHPRAIVRR